MAMRAPSSLNTQPWNFYVVSGDPLDRIRAGNTERNLAASRHRASSAPRRICGRAPGTTDRDRQAAVCGHGDRAA